MRTYATGEVRNIVILGHSGCGKTSVTESALFYSGAIKRQGKVSDGNTTSDYDPEEIKRGMKLFPESPKCLNTLSITNAIRTM